MNESGELPTSVDSNRNRKFEISITPSKAKSRETAYSQVLVHNKIDRQRVRIRRVGHAGGQSDGYGGWYLELIRGEVRRGG